jgi:amino acid transporter
MNERTLGTIVRDLTEDLSTLVRSEVALAKLELKQTATTIGGAGALLFAALFCLLFASAFLLVTIALALAELGVPPWLSSLIVAVLLIAVAAVMALIGRKKLSKLQVVPTSTIESIKTDIATIKTDLSRVRQKT